MLVGLPVPVPGVSVAFGCAVPASGQDCRSTSSWTQSVPLAQISSVSVEFSSPRQSTTCLPPNVSTVLQPVSVPGGETVVADVTSSNVEVSGITRMALPIPCIQNWHSNKMTSAPVTGMPGVPFVAVPVPATSVVSVAGTAGTVSVVSAVAVPTSVSPAAGVPVPAVSVVFVSRAGGGDAVMSRPGSTVVGVPSSGAQAATSSTKVNGDVMEFLSG